MKCVFRALAVVATAVCLVLSAPSALAEKSEPTPTPSEFEAAVSEALQAFEARDFERALRHFDVAIALGADAEQLSTLEFDAGVCAFELGRYEEAERRFAASAAFRTKDRDMALVHAGFAALRANAADRAERHFANLSPAGRELPLGKELAEELSSERAARERNSALSALRAGFEALERDDLGAASGSFAAARRRATHLLDEELANLDYGEARVAERRGDIQGAVRHLDRAIALTPMSCDLERYRGRLLERLGELDAALAAQRRALACARSDEDARLAAAEIDALHPLGRPGFRGFVQASGGYDTNAAQSGTASRLDEGLPFMDAATVDTSSVVGSPLIGVSGRIAYDHRLTFSWALVPRYQTSNLLLTNSEVNDSSLGIQELALGVAHAPNAHTRLELYTGLAALTSGLPPLDPLTFEAFVGAEAELRLTTNVSLFGAMRYTDVTGADSVSSLTGRRLEGELGARLYTGRLSAGARARLSWNEAGTVAWSTTPDPFGCGRRDFRFDPACDLLGFEVPTSYLAPSAEVDLSYWPFDVFRVGGVAGVARRDALEPVRVYRLPQGELVSEKTRRDVTVDLAVELRVLPWRNLNVYGFVRQSARINISNMQPDANDPNHRYDYDDRNYTQAISELGVGFAF